MAQRQWRSDDTDTWLESFGSGEDGSTYAVPTNEGCSGTSGATTLTLATAGSFANTDLVLIHQTRGTGAGVWELNKISSGGGSTSLTMAYSLTNTYTDSGASQAQIIKLNEYENITTGAVTGPTWDGSKGGIVAFLASGTCTIDSAINVNSIGFVGGQGSGNANILGRQGGGYPNENHSESTSANGNGGGGGATGANNPGSGGGNGTAGTSAGGGSGGSTSGTASLVTMHFSGSGGGSSADSGAPTGGRGCGIVIIIAKEIVVTGSITGRGGEGGTAAGHTSGHGAGASILLKAEIATLGSNLITAPVRTGGNGGAGGVGRIHLDYSGSYTGTTSPTIDVTLDSTIVAPSGGSTGYAFFM